MPTGEHPVLLVVNPPLEERSMFGKKDPVGIKSLIAQGTRIRGDMKFEEGLRVDGDVYGSIHAETVDGSLLVISEGALVEGSLKADHVIINGTVKGPVEARDLHLESKAKIEGEVQYLTLEIQSGASVLGRLRPIESAAASSDDDKSVVRLAAKN
jgi:cytoskeletal protein CcmA (bactofilin family)